MSYIIIKYSSNIVYTAMHSIYGLHDIATFIMVYGRLHYGRLWFLITGWYIRYLVTNREIHGTHNKIEAHNKYVPGYSR